MEWTPTVIGSSEEGLGTYTIQNGYYDFANYQITFSARIVWTAHTGTGNLYLSLPKEIRTTNKLLTGNLILQNVTLPESSVQSFIGFVKEENHCRALCSQDNGEFLKISLSSSGDVFYSGSYMVDSLPE